MKFRMHPLAAAIAVALSASASAQTRQAGPSTLDEVVVSATRPNTVGNATVLNNQSLAPLRPATSDVASLLREVPGVSLYGAGGVSSLPAIHGLADDRLRISVDGMDLIASCPNHMNPPLSYLSPSGIGKLTVYAGITPVSVGGDSIGGSIVADTPAPEFAAPGQGMTAKGEIGGFYRSNNRAKGARLSASAATENLNISYSGDFAKADNYKAGGDFKSQNGTGRLDHTLARDEVGSTAYDTRTHTLGVALRGGNHLIDAKFGYQDISEQLFPNQRMDMLDNTQKRFNLRYRGDFEWGALEARAYHERVDHFMDFGADKRFWYGNAAPPAGSGGPMALNGSPCSPISATCAAGMPMQTESRTTGVSLKTDLFLGTQDLLRLGSLVQAYRLDDWWPPSGAAMFPGTFDNIKDGRRDRSALFGEWESRLSPSWTSLLGLRFERVQSNAGNVRGYNPTTNGMAPMLNNQQADAAAFNVRDRERTDNNWDLTALARYAPNPNTDIEFGFARKVRSPNLYERYTWSSWSMAAVMNNFVGDGNGYIGNPDLKPEKARTLSATVDWHAKDRSWSLKATPFYNEVDDYIDAIRCTSGASCTAANLSASNQFVVLQYANQSARLYGLDLSGQMPLAQNPLGNFSLKGLISYTRGENRDTGDDLYNIMPLNARLTVGHQLGGWDNAVEWVMARGKEHVSDVRNEIRTAGYGLTHLRTSYAWTRVRLDLGVENLFDKRYTLPQGGAYVGQGSTMMLNAPNVPWGIGVPGMGRSIYAGVNLQF